MATIISWPWCVKWMHVLLPHPQHTKCQYHHGWVQRTGPQQALWEATTASQVLLRSRRLHRFPSRPPWLLLTLPRAIQSPPVLSSVMTSLPQSQVTSLSPIPPQVTSRNQLHKAISAAMSIMPQTAVKLKLEMIRHYLKISISYMNMCIWEMVISAGTQRQAFSHSCCYKPCQQLRIISLQGWF